MREPAASVALIAPNWLGDAVMSLGALAELTATRVAVVAPSYVARVFRGVDGVDELVATRPLGRLRRVVERARVLRALRPDAAVILPPSFSAALVARLAGVPARVGLATDGRGALLTDPRPDPGRRAHLGATYRMLARATLTRLDAGDAAPGATSPSMRVYGEDEREAAALRRSFGVEADYAVVAPGAAYGPAKTWPAERFGALAASLARDLPVVLAGSARDAETCAAIAADQGGVFDASARTSLGGFFALLAGAHVVVANDSGAPHCAAALGTPTVVVFGSTAPEWTAPQGEWVEVVRHPVPCSPCFRRFCPTQLECFAGVEVADVLARARRGADAGRRKASRG
jgi:heptosyltransferase-2